MDRKKLENTQYGLKKTTVIIFYEIISLDAKKSTLNSRKPCKPHHDQIKFYPYSTF